MEFPLKMRVLSLERIPADPRGEGGHETVECFYEVVDAKGEVTLPRNHFVCKSREFDEVANYTLERLGARFTKSQTSDIKPASDAVARTLADLRGDQVAPAEVVATPLDQTISPPGPVRKVAVK